MSYCRFNDGTHSDKSTVYAISTFKNTWEIRSDHEGEIRTDGAYSLGEFRDKLFELRTQGAAIPERVFVRIASEMQPDGYRFDGVKFRHEVKV